MTAPNDGKRYWLDDPKNVDKLFYLVCLVCGLVTVADFFYDKHGHFAVENLPGFHGAFGFVAYVGLVLTATQLRKLLKRKEDFYD